MSCSSSIEPIRLPIYNVTVSSDGQAISRGIELSVGNPPQIFSFQPSTSTMDLFLNNAGDCDGKSNSSCVGQRGGVFDPAASDTYIQSTKAQWNGSEFSREQPGSYIFFNDEINYGSGGSSEGYPMFMNQPPFFYQGGLGLGFNSTFLDVLWTSEQSPSKSFGLWVGGRSIYNPEDGHVIIGGYDAARVEGNFTSFPSYEECPSCVNVTSIVWNSEAGSEPLMAEGAAPIEVGFEPFIRNMELPDDVFQRYFDLTNGSWDDLNGLTYSPENTPEGNLTITLEGGYETTIPASELFTKPRNFEDGIYEIIDQNLTIGLLNNNTEEGYVARWGVPFLAINYMVIDYHKMEFQLAPAIWGEKDPLTSTGIPIDPQIEAICGPSSSDGSGGGSNAGAIAGGVVGGLCGLALLVLVFWWFFWRKRRQNTQNTTSDQTGGAGGAAYADQKLKPPDLSSGKRLSEMESPMSSNQPFGVNEMASPEQMQGNFHGIYAQQRSSLEKKPLMDHDRANAQELYASVPESGPERKEGEPVELPADHRA